ncbi:hypothetical protein [Mesobacterium pallidum]|uniref:hypothetical protein n=1 Tax=Mesobacterium pallidum TaxID=2872037 RepID=UPI001EE177AE|nr:hypothetical protein [Mesobacterium pallidum]
MWIHYLWLATMIALVTWKVLGRFAGFRRLLGFAPLVPDSGGLPRKAAWPGPATLPVTATYSAGIRPRALALVALGAVLSLGFAEWQALLGIDRSIGYLIAVISGPYLAWLAAYVFLFRARFDGTELQTITFGLKPVFADLRQLTSVELDPSGQYRLQFRDGLVVNLMAGVDDRAGMRARLLAASPVTAPPHGAANRIRL